jgi:hypothetical protein
VISETTQERNKRYRELLMTTIAGDVLKMWGDLAFAGRELYYSYRSIDDSHIRDFYAEATDQLSMENEIPQLYDNILVFGQYVAHLNFDEQKRYFTDCLIHDPDYTEVKVSPLDGSVQAYVHCSKEHQYWATSVDPQIVARRAEVDPLIVEHMASGKPIELHPENMLHLGYDTPPDVKSLLVNVKPGMSSAEILYHMGVEIENIKHTNSFLNKFVSKASHLRELITERTVIKKMLYQLAEGQQFLHADGSFIVPIVCWANTEPANHRAIVMRLVESTNIPLDELERIQQACRRRSVTTSEGVER